jgi:hypothetical protein
MIRLVAGFIVLIFDSLSILPHRRKAQGCAGKDFVDGGHGHYLLGRLGDFSRQG